MQRALVDDDPTKGQPKVPRAAPVLEWEARVMRGPGQKLGVAVKWIEGNESGPVVVTQVNPGMLLDVWNGDQKNENVPAVRREDDEIKPACVRGLQVLPGDFLVSLNGQSLVGCSHEEKKARMRGLSQKNCANATLVLGFARV